MCSTNKGDKMQTSINDIDIRVTKAFIKSVSFRFYPDSQLPKIDISISLLTGTNKQLVDVSFSTQDYYGKQINEDSIPVSVHSKIADIVSQLNPIVQREINQIEGLLNANT